MDASFTHLTLLWIKSDFFFLYSCVFFTLRIFCLENDKEKFSIIVLLISSWVVIVK